MEKNSRIKVTGKGSIHVVPDVTRLRVMIDRVFKTYDEAYKQAKENARWIAEILEYNKKSGKLAKTIRFDITEHTVSKYDSKNNYIGQVKDGYDLDQCFKIDLGIDSVLLNKIIRGVGKFIPGAQVRVGYTILDPRPFQLKMLERAIKDATEKAKIMALAAGCKLGSVSSIKYGQQELEIYSEARNIHSNEEAMACNSSSLDITPDDLSMNDTVDVEWELEEI